MVDRNNNKKTPTCSECSRLWRAYLEATQSQLELMHSMPSRNTDFDAIQELEGRIELAAARRERTWQEIQEHEESVHGRHDAGVSIDKGE
ncbi:MAG TPA: hypothetical protein VFA54_09395 [Bryobacterales bacterium]|jgi:hypothetical protein|nr:hypothetical protein [Bryobacterales bacterium]